MTATDAGATLDRYSREVETPPRTPGSTLALDVIGDFLAVKLAAELGDPRRARAFLVDALDRLADLEDTLEAETARQCAREARDAKRAARSRR